MQASKVPPIKFGICPFCVTAAVAVGTGAIIAARKARSVKEPSKINNGPASDQVDLRKDEKAEGKTSKKDKSTESTGG